MRKTLVTVALVLIAPSESARADSEPPERGKERKEVPRGQDDRREISPAPRPLGRQAKPVVERSPSCTSSDQRSSVEGCWDFVIKMPFLHPNMRGKFSLTLDGNALRGTAMLHGEVFPLRDGVLQDSRLRFNVERLGVKLAFQGNFTDAQLHGTMTKSGEQRSWIAKRCR